MNKLHLLLLFLLLAACGSQASTIPGSKIPDNPITRDIVQAVEDYRVAVERKDTAALMLMASESYWEDGGTPTGTDDYGFKGLRDILTTRFQQVQDVRYSMRYMNVYRRCQPGTDSGTNEGCRAYVDVLIDASYSFVDANGNEKRNDKRDQNQLVLEWNGEKWLFLSGM